MNLVVSGSRSIKNPKVVYNTLLIYSESHYIDLLITGGAKGVDHAAMNWAECNNIPHFEYLPNYNFYGKIAPLVRNEKMATKGDELIAIWDGKSKGTIHTVKCFERLHKEVTLININGIPGQHTYKESKETVEKDLAIKRMEESS